MDIVLLAAALLPAIALMAYVRSHDKVESEPMGLVMRVFFLGAASGLVAAMVEGVIIDVFEAVLPEGIILLVAEYFIGVAAVEEACKYACLNTIRRHPEFDYLFDAIVYSVAAALGFAALENVFYVFDPINGGLDTAVMRAILSVPGHAADGVVMGVFFGLARQRELHGNAAGAKSYYWLAFLLPVIEHGFYDAALSTDSDGMALLAMAFDLAFIGIAFALVKRTSANDAPLHPEPPAQPRMQAPTASQGTQGAYGQGPYAQSRDSFAHAAPSQGVPSQGTFAQPSPPQEAFTQHGAAQPQPQGMFAQPSPSHADSASTTWVCPYCHQTNSGRFCVNCGARKQ